MQRIRGKEKTSKRERQTFQLEDKQTKHYDLNGKDVKSKMESDSDKTKKEKEWKEKENN